MRNKIQLDATYYFIMLMLGSTCFGHHYEVKCRQDGRVSGPKAVPDFGPDTYPSCLHLTSNQQQLENQTVYVVTKRYRRELLMMGIMVPETC